MPADGAPGAARGLLSHVPAAGNRLWRVGSLWTGVGATLARDVPFSALYWGLVEPIRGALMAGRGGAAGRPSQMDVLAVNVAGEDARPAGCMPGTGGRVEARCRVQG